MTDEMELINPNTYITVATITDSTKRRRYVTVQEINDALSASSRSPEWQYIRFKIILNGGNEASGVMTKTPLAWSMRAVHNNTKDEL